MRRITIIGMSLLAGTGLTLATAWIPPLIDPPLVRFPGLSLEPGQSVPWIGAPHTEWLGEPAWLATEGRPGIGVRRSFGCVEAADIAHVPSSGRWYYLLASGWPMYAFHGGGVQYQRPPSSPPINDLRAPAAFPLPSWVPTRQNHLPSVPIAPLWKGLTINIAWWSLLAGGTMLGGAALRRGLRRRAGRCERCGYSVRGIGTRCPECGFGHA